MSSSNRAVVLALLAAFGSTGLAHAKAEGPVDIAGVYRVVSDRTVLPGGLRNHGGPADVAVLARPDVARDSRFDPARACQPVGPFRMMARPDLVVEFAPTGRTVLMLFQDISHGHLRTLYLGRGHRTDLEPGFEGDSVAHWQGGALHVETTGFNDQVWLDDRGLQHSDGLKLEESIRPILGQQYLEYKMQVVDLKALQKSYVYVRYLKRVKEDVAEDVCEIEDK